jgi:predicted RNA-binding protein YlxR (DUF448 family)
MSSTKRKTNEEFINDARKKHGDKYDYSKVEYVNQNTKVCIICPKHGEFWQKPKSHLNGRGCKLCGNEICSSIRKNKTFPYKKRKQYDTDMFITEANNIHNNKYDYSKVIYKNSNTDVCIICPKHGEFWQKPAVHLTQKSECPKCANEKRHERFVSNSSEFINKANLVFYGKYLYNNVNYYNNSTKVSITCPIHGDFLCTPQNHLKGRGCPICKSESYVYETRLYYFLKTIFKDDEIIRQYKTDWLTNNKSLDFFIPKYNLAIEHQGEQHVKPIEIFGGEDKFNKYIIRDKEKYDECKNNNVNLLYFSYEKYVDFSNFFDKVILNEEELLEKINEIIKKTENE